MEAYGVTVTFVPPRRPQGNGLCERTHRSLKTVPRGLMAGQRGSDWIKNLPLATHILNNQLMKGLDMSPMQLFLGRPGWKSPVLEEVDGHPKCRDWLEHVVGQ